MHYAHLFRCAAALGLTVATITASHAQNLGGMLGRAKAKVAQATSSPSQAMQAATQDGPPTTPPTLTTESNAEYTRDLMAYANRQTFRPSSDPDPTFSEVYNYCSLHAQGYPFRFTWDQAAIASSADNRTYLTGFFSDVASDLVSGLNSRFGPSLKPKLAKVKEIHFTTSPKKRSLDDFGTLGGYFFSFNPATGVLTAAMSEPDGAISISSDLFLTKWITKYVK